MGLFSFIKNAGAKLFGRDDDKKEATTTKVSREQALKYEVQRLGIPIEDLHIEVNGETVTVTGRTETNANREKIILALGNVEGVSSVDDRIAVINPEPEASFYEVKKGDSLSKISKEFYGDPMKYNQIFEANQPLLKDPDKIYPGQVLRIPKK